MDGITLLPSGCVGQQFPISIFKIIRQVCTQGIESELPTGLQTVKILFLLLVPEPTGETLQSNACFNKENVSTLAAQSAASSEYNPRCRVPIDADWSWSRLWLRLLLGHLWGDWMWVSLKSNVGQKRKKRYFKSENSVFQKNEAEGTDNKDILSNKWKINTLLNYINRFYLWNDFIFI